MKSRKLTGEQKHILLEYDSILQARILEEFNIKIGDFSIQKITTRPNHTFGLIGSGPFEGFFLNSETNIVSGGYVKHYDKGTDVHIAPVYANGDRIDFITIVGHELIHAINAFIIPHHSALFSERAAYQKQYDFYLQENRIDAALETKRTASETFLNGEPLWGPYPPQYDVHRCIDIYETMRQGIDTMQSNILNAIIKGNVNFKN
jgi:hypothetical protein